MPSGESFFFLLLKETGVIWWLQAKTILKFLGHSMDIDCDMQPGLRQDNSNWSATGKGGKFNYYFKVFAIEYMFSMKGHMYVRVCASVYVHTKN